MKFDVIESITLANSIKQTIENKRSPIHDLAKIVDEALESKTWYPLIELNKQMNLFHFCHNSSAICNG